MAQIFGANFCPPFTRVHDFAAVLFRPDIQVANLEVCTVQWYYAVKGMTGGSPSPAVPQRTNRSSPGAEVFFPVFIKIYTQPAAAGDSVCR